MSGYQNISLIEIMESFLLKIDAMKNKEYANYF